MNISVSVYLSASDVMEIDRIGGVYGLPRAKLVRCVVQHFVQLPDAQIRAWMLEDERYRKKAELTAEKARIDKELALVDRDLKMFESQRGCADAPQKIPSKRGGVEQQDAAPKGGN